MEGYGVPEAFELGDELTARATAHMDESQRREYGLRIRPFSSVRQRGSGLLLSVCARRGPRDRVGERLSEYRCCLAGLRHFWHGSRIRWG